MIIETGIKRDNRDVMLQQVAKVFDSKTFSIANSDLASVLIIGSLFGLDCNRRLAIDSLELKITTNPYEILDGIDSCCTFAQFNTAENRYYFQLKDCEEIAVNKGDLRKILKFIKYVDGSPDLLQLFAYIYAMMLWDARNVMPLAYAGKYYLQDARLLASRIHPAAYLPLVRDIDEGEYLQIVSTYTRQCKKMMAAEPRQLMFSYNLENECLTEAVRRKSCELSTATGCKAIAKIAAELRKMQWNSVIDSVQPEENSMHRSTLAGRRLEDVVKRASSRSSNLDDEQLDSIFSSE